MVGVLFDFFQTTMWAFATRLARSSDQPATTSLRGKSHTTRFTQDSEFRRNELGPHQRKFHMVLGGAYERNRPSHSRNPGPSMAP
jgi:hypothetical protein